MKFWKRLFLTAYNALDFRLRNLFAFSRGKAALGEKDPGPSWSSALEDDQARARQRVLGQDYRLGELLEYGSQDLYLKNLFYLDALDQAFARCGVILPDPLAAVDVGPSHWFYVRALWASVTWWARDQPRDVILEGYEPDAYRVYPDLYSRRDHARAHVGNLDDVVYHPDPFPGGPARYDLVTQFFPFMFLDDHLAWGLPRRKFSPSGLMEELWISLKPGGTWLILNQGTGEHREQVRLLEKLFERSGCGFRLTSPFYAYDQPTMITVVRKTRE